MQARASGSWPARSEWARFARALCGPARGLPVVLVALVAIAGLASAGRAGETPPASQAAADAAADVAARSLPQSAVMSSVAQSWRGADNDVIYAHFDLGAAPNLHRFYCLVDGRNGKRQPNGVIGEPFTQKDGSTGIHMSSVSLYRCDDAQRAGYLETAPYHLSGPAAAAQRAIAAPPTPAPAAASPGAASATAAPESVAASASGASSAAGTESLSAAGSAPTVTSSGASASTGSREGPARVEVAGVRLGMRVEEVRAALRAHGLLDYLESQAPRTAEASSGRFVSRLLAWTPPGAEGEGESIEVLLTPVPGLERAYAVIHTLLEKKYGGFAAGPAVPAAPTWRLESGAMVTGDVCEQRGLFGGLHEIPAAPAERSNPLLSMSVEDLDSQVHRCGSVIVTEDHVALSGGATRESRRIARFTISAYSPAVALEAVRGSRPMRASAAQRTTGGETESSPALSDL